MPITTNILHLRLTNWLPCLTPMLTCHFTASLMESQTQPYLYLYLSTHLKGFLCYDMWPQLHCSLAQSLTAEQSLMHSLCCGQSPVHSLPLMYISWSLLAFHEITTYFPPQTITSQAHTCKTWTQFPSSAKSQSDISCKLPKTPLNNIQILFGNIWNIL